MNSATLQSKQQEEMYRDSQARLTYIREDLNDAHWACRIAGVGAGSGTKFIGIRTAAGIHYVRVKHAS